MTVQARPEGPHWEEARVVLRHNMAGWGPAKGMGVWSFAVAEVATGEWG